MFNILSPTERRITVAVVHVTLPEQSLIASGIEFAFFSRFFSLEKQLKNN